MGAALVVLPLGVVGMVRSGRVGMDLAVVVPSLRTASAVLGVVVLGTALSHWRATGRAHGLLLGVAAGLLAAQSCIDLATAGRPGVTAAAACAACLGAVVWMARAVVGPEVDTRLRPGVELVRACGVMVAAAAVLAVVDLTPVMPAALTAAWLLVGVVGIARALQRGWRLMGWGSWAAIAFGVGELSVAWPASDAMGEFVRATMHAAGLLVAAIGGGAVLSAVAIARRGDVHGLVVDARRRSADRDHERRELMHEVRNVVLVIEGAASTLERLGPRLDPGQRARIEQALRTGIADLRALVTGDRVDHPEVFAIDQLVRERALAADLRGMHVEVDAPRRLHVHGVPALMARVLDNVLLNAERHGRAGSIDDPVRLTVRAHAAQAVVRVVDAGPGVSDGFRDLVFERGRRGDPDGTGDGLGLHVARTLMRSQGGDVTCEPVRAGACFAIWSPLARSAVLEGAGGPPTSELHDGR